MSKWAYVENGEAVELYDELPSSWRNVSNLFALENDLETLGTLSWYPVLDVTPAITNSNTQLYGATTWVFDQQNHQVVQSTEIITRDFDEASFFQQQRTAFMNYLRGVRDSLIAATDWTQLSDIQAQKSSQWIQDYAQYRQALRDLPEVYNADPYTQELNINNIVFPTAPQE